MEDAIALARVLNDRTSRLTQTSMHDRPPLGRALQRYQDERSTEALRLQNAARNSMEWFENVRRYIHLPPEQFAYSLLTRSQRVSHENLRFRDRRYLEGWSGGSPRARRGARDGNGNREREEVAASSEQQAASVPGSQFPVPSPQASIPPMFTPYRLRELEVANRIVVSPMDVYSATDGVPNDFHLVHLGAPGARWCRTRVHRDGLRIARGTHHARMHRALRARARRGMDAHRGLRP
jgi:anthraniloyl-CoA monooxygenase